MTKHDPVKEVLERNQEKLSQIVAERKGEFVFDVEFENAEELKKKHKGTFHIPSQIERSNVQLGKSVKVIFEGERFWVQVIDEFYISGKKAYLGVVSAHLLGKKLGHGSAVIIEPRHIIAITDEMFSSEDVSPVLVKNEVNKPITSILEDVIDGNIDINDLIEEDHKKVMLHHPHWNEDIEIEEGVSELVSLLWKDDIGVFIANQKLRSGVMFLRFYTTFELERFLNMLVIHRDKELGDQESLYHRVTDADQEGGWVYDMLVEDISWKYDEDKDEMVTAGPAEIRFTASVVFPVTDYKQVLKYVKKYQATHGSNFQNPFESNKNTGLKGNRQNLAI